MCAVESHSGRLVLEVLREIMSHGVNGLCNRLAEHGIVGRLLTHGEELFSILNEFWVPKTVEVGPRHGIDHFPPDLDADFAVLVENVFIQLILVDA